VLVVAIINLIHFLVTIFPSHMYAAQVSQFWTVFKGILKIIACVCRGGVEAGFFELVYG
jgi:hypothetical protein